MLKIKVHLYGRHSNRTPMAYSDYRVLFSKGFEFVENILEADLVVLGYSVDFNGLSSHIDEIMAKRPTLKFCVISEEPLWDMSSDNDPFSNVATWKFDNIHIPFGVFNHLNTDIFSFSSIPYFITTESKFISRYIYEFSRRLNTSLSSCLFSKWSQPQFHFAFLQQKRFDGEKLGINSQGRQLSTYRCQLACELQKYGALVEGYGWGNTKPRQQLFDWHLDKLVKFRDKVAVFSAIENTHVKHYLTEKIFDAFAIGAFPIYLAKSDHSVFKLIPEESFINLADLSLNEAVDKLLNWEPQRASVDCYLETVFRLKALFGNHETLVNERLNVVNKIEYEIQRFLDW